VKLGFTQLFAYRNLDFISAFSSHYPLLINEYQKMGNFMKKRGLFFSHSSEVQGQGTTSGDSFLASESKGGSGHQTARDRKYGVVSSVSLPLFYFFLFLRMYFFIYFGGTES
jgi:hypothetical protein